MYPGRCQAITASIADRSAERQESGPLDNQGVRSLDAVTQYIPGIVFLAAALGL
jgi:hypothetical protein